MKKLIIVAIIAIAFASASSAQVKSVGIRGGYGVELSYQQWFGYPHFLEVDLGMDIVGDDGFKVTGTYNWVVGNPQYTYGGAWDIYMGPGVSLGYVYDTKGSPNSDASSAMAAFVVQFGIEYYPAAHFGISADIRPMIGYHFGSNDIYRAGLYGFIPSLALRYEF